MSEGTAVLDHGYVRLIETWGSDERIIEAARMSVDKGFEGWGPLHYCPEHSPSAPLKWACLQCGKWEEKPGDEKLLRFLWENRHTTPFEMAGAIFEIKAPIFVFREWHRHRTQSYNEMSARYVPLPDENYVPTVERLLMSGGANKQAQGTEGKALTDAATALHLQGLLECSYTHAQHTYQTLLDHGTAKELARLVVPVARYSRMRASAVLKNWLDFLTLRDDSKAQWEIQQYAAAVRALLAERFPRTLELYTEKRERAQTMTDAAKVVLERHHQMIDGQPSGGCVAHDTAVDPPWPCGEARLALAVLGRER